MFLKSSTLFLLHLELKSKNGFKLKTGFDYSFKRNIHICVFIVINIISPVSEDIILCFYIE